MIGIIGAMAIEIEGLAKLIEEKKETVVGSLNFISGHISGTRVVLVKSGIGKVNAGFAATLMIQSFPVSSVINIGVAGGIGKGVKQGDIVVGEKTVYHDYDQTEDGLPKGQVPGFGFTFFPSSKRLVDKLCAVLEAKQFKFHCGVIASGDQFISSLEKSKWINSEFTALACDMESAAISHICCLLKVDFVSMRAISDNANEQGVDDFYAFVEKAAKKSTESITEFIKSV